MKGYVTFQRHIICTSQNANLYATCCVKSTYNDMQCLKIRYGSKITDVSIKSSRYTIMNLQLTYSFLNMMYALNHMQNVHTTYTETVLCSLDDHKPFKCDTFVPVQQI